MDRGKWMNRSLVTKIAAVVGGVILLAAVIFGVAAISSPTGAPGGLPFIPVGSDPASTSPALIPTFTAGTTSTPGATGTSTTVATTPLSTRTTGDGNSNDYRVNRTTTTGNSTTGSNGQNGGSGNGSGSKTTTKTVPPAPPKTIKDHLPKSVTGFTSSGTQIYKTTTAQMALQPNASTHVPMSLALLTVHDFGTTAKAQSFIEKSIKTLYPDNQQSVPVNGGYIFYGTQGTTFGEAAFYSGHFAYEVTVTSNNGDPLGLKDEAMAIASTFNLPEK